MIALVLDFPRFVLRIDSSCTILPLTIVILYRCYWFALRRDYTPAYPSFPGGSRYLVGPGAPSK